VSRVNLQGCAPVIQPQDPRAEQGDVVEMDNIEAPAGEDAFQGAALQ
jgi:hypothetical protein